MSPSRPNAILSLLLLCTVLIPLPPLLTKVYGAEEKITFSRTPTGYSNQTGSFILGRQLTYDAGYGEVCVMYDYFIFTAHAGTVLRGQVQTGSLGRVVFYVILNSPYQLYSFQNSNCGIGNWGQVQGFNSPSTLNWTSPEDGQYALVFISNGFYGGTVNFTQ